MFPSDKNSPWLETHFHHVESERNPDFNSFFFKEVAQRSDQKDIYCSMFQFVGPQVIGLTIVLAFPSGALWLPTVLVS